MASDPQISLEQVLKDIHIPEADIRQLRDKHSVKSYDCLQGLRHRFENRDLEGITTVGQELISCLLGYFDGVGASQQISDDPFAFFDKFRFVVSLKTKGDKLDRTAISSNILSKKRVMDDLKLDHAAKLARMSQMKRVAKKQERTEKTVDEIESELASSGLQLALQGFGHTNIYQSSSVDDSSEQADKRVSSFAFKGKTFNAGRCYLYRQKCGKQITVGIKHINPIKEEAKCVLIWPKSETFLGKIDLEAFESASRHLGEYVQIQADLAPLPLCNFLDAPAQISDMPEFVYLPQVLGCSQTYGYFFQNNMVNRVGVRSKKLRLLELYAGAGGSHQAYKSEGFEAAGVVELWPLAMKTFRHNNPEIPIERTFNMAVESFLETYKTNEDFRNMIGPIDVLHGSPPCQGFSGANVYGGKDDLTNKQETLTCLEVVRAVNPTVFIYENVVGIWCREHSAYISKVQTELLKLNYQVLCTVARSSSFGSCQKRPRFLIFAVKKNIPLSPRLLLEKPYGDGFDQLPFVTVQSVLSPLQVPSAKNFPNMQHAKTTSLQDGEHKVVKLQANELAPTVRGGGVILHYDQDRCVNVREAASMQGFPLDYEFFGSISDMYKQVGNAVPFELALALARMAKDTLRFNYEGGDDSSERLLAD